jgi:hypothetical protein
LRIAEEEEGWLKRVASPAPMLNDRQSITARSLCWFTCTSDVPCPEIDAEPALTIPPFGLACAGATASAASPNASVPPPSAVLAYSLPVPMRLFPAMPQA